MGVSTSLRRVRRAPLVASLATVAIGALAGALALVAPVAAHAQAAGIQPQGPPPTAARATVAVRVVLDTADGPALVREGAGFFITPRGHLLTTYRAVGGVVTNEPGVVQDPLGALQGRVEVVWTVPGSALGPQAFDATVLAASAERDLALLSVTGVAAVPYLPAGDSDALVMNQSITAFAAPPARAPGGGNALAPGRSGRIRALPIPRPGARVPPWIATDIVWGGGVGGPLLDAEGYVVGVVRADALDGSQTGTVVPINLARDLFDGTGVSAMLPPRLALGEEQAFPAKGLRMRVAGALQDAWPGRTRWESAPDPVGLVLRIDRVISSLGTGELGASLVAGLLGDPAAVARKDTTGSRPVPGGRAGHVGSATGQAGEVPFAMEYAIFSLGQEKVVARYIAAADLVAYNRGVLRQSLESLQAGGLLAQAIAAPLAATFEPGAPGAGGVPGVRAPAGWLAEPTLHAFPAGLPAPDAVASWSPKNDFTVTLRCSWWRTAPMTAPYAAAAVMAGRGAPNLAEFEYSEDVFGMPWVAAGSFVDSSGGLLLLELRAPAQKIPFVRDLFLQWVAANRRDVPGRPAR